MFKFASLFETIRRFGQDRRGNVLVMTGLAIVPLMGVVGVSVDYSRATNVRQALSSAIDAASLMAARDAQKPTDADLKRRIDGWIRDNLPPEAKKPTSLAPRWRSIVTPRTIQIAANANVPVDDRARDRHAIHTRRQQHPVDLGHEQDRTGSGAR